MINDLKVVKFNCQLYVIIQVRDDYTANDKTVLRSIKNIEGHQYIKQDGELINVDDEVTSYHMKEEYDRKARNWYEETKF